MAAPENKHIWGSGWLSEKGTCRSEERGVPGVSKGCRGVPGLPGSQHRRDGNQGAGVGRVPWASVGYT